MIKKGMNALKHDIYKLHAFRSDAEMPSDDSSCWHEHLSKAGIPADHFPGISNREDHCADGGTAGHEVWH